MNQDSKKTKHRLRFYVITIFPDFFASPLAYGLMEKAGESGIVDINVINLRDFAKGRHNQVDDTPYGGGPGMVLMPEPLVKAIENAKELSPGARVIALSPGGEKLTDSKASELADEEALVLVCGRYEGIDQRIVDHYCDEEISIGDYVLTGGEPAALVLMDAVSRHLPGVIGDPDSVSRDSFKHALTHPQYTRPREFKGHSVPEVLFSGDHGAIEKWREEAARERTRRFRPEMLGALAAKNTWIIYAAKNNAEKESFHRYTEISAGFSVVVGTFGLGGVVMSIPPTQIRQPVRDRAPANVSVKGRVKDAIEYVEKKSGKSLPALAVAEDDGTKALPWDQAAETIHIAGGGILVFCEDESAFDDAATGNELMIIYPEKEFYNTGLPAIAKASITLYRIFGTEK